MNKIVILAGLLATSMFYMSCESHHEEEEHEIEFIVTTPFITDTTVTKEYVCQIHSIQHIELRAFEEGYLQNIYVDEGQFINKGEVMFEIMPMILEAELKKAQAELSFADIEYKNTKQLADQNVVSQNELALAKAKYDKASADLALAQVHLDFTKVKAPFSGIMDKFQVRLGSLLEEGELLTSLSDNSKMWVYFNVPEAEYLNYKKTEKKDSVKTVYLEMANNEMFDYPGIIETIEADFNNETGNIAFRATFPNPDGLLRHGETGNIMMIAPFKNAMIIPQKATFEILEKKYVFIVDENNVVHQTEIQIAAEMPDLYVINGGISANDQILLEGIRKVKDGDKIKFRIEAPEEVIPHLNVYVE